MHQRRKISTRTHSASHKLWRLAKEREREKEGHASTCCYLSELPCAATANTRLYDILLFISFCLAAVVVAKVVVVVVVVQCCCRHCHPDMLHCLHRRACPPPEHIDRHTGWGALAHPPFSLSLFFPLHYTFLLTAKRQQVDCLFVRA